MVILQISKFRVKSKQGPRLQDEWFSYAHIGQERGGKTLTREEFLEMEDKYLRAVHRFMAGASISNLRAHEIEYWDETNERLAELALDDVLHEGSRPVEGEELSSLRLGNAFRRCFREAAWLEFYWQHRFLVHLGHDLQLTIATEGRTKQESDETRNDGLFVHPGTTSLPTLEAWRRTDAGW